MHVGGTPIGAHFDDLIGFVEAEGVDDVDALVAAIIVEVHREGEDGIVARDPDRAFKLQFRAGLHGLGIEGADRLAAMVDGGADRVFDRRVWGIEGGHLVGAARLERGDIGVDGGFHLDGIRHGFGSNGIGGEKAEGEGGAQAQLSGK